MEDRMHVVTCVRSVEGAGEVVSRMPCCLVVGLRTMRPLAGACAVAWLETGTASPHQECPPRRPLLIEEVVGVHHWNRSTQGVAYGGGDRRRRTGRRAGAR